MVTSIWLFGVIISLILMSILEYSGRNTTEYKSTTHQTLTNLVIISSSWLGVFFILYNIVYDEEERG